MRHGPALKRQAPAADLTGKPRDFHCPAAPAASAAGLKGVPPRPARPGCPQPGPRPQHLCHARPASLLPATASAPRGCGVPAGETLPRPGGGCLRESPAGGGARWATGRLPTCSAPPAGSRGSLPAEPCIAPIVTSLARALPPLAPAARPASRRPDPPAAGTLLPRLAPAAREGPEGTGQAAGRQGRPEPARDKAGTKEPATERLCTAGARPPSATSQSNPRPPRGGEETFSFSPGRKELLFSVYKNISCVLALGSG